MIEIDKCCTIYPYFQVKPGKLADFKKLCQRLIEQTQKEPKCLYYGFSFAGDLVHCREGYEDAEGLLAHLNNVDSLLAEALNLAELTRLEIHACETELAKLREPLAHLKPKFFTLAYGFRR
ncbi:MAG: hypothetical protein D6756_10095 [Cyanobacteria bacterium J083]|nr:MAG: hypothetical protein D6756_10095 [Cyanobacteria bacterium J083]